MKSTIGLVILVSTLCACNQPASTVVQEIDAGVAIGKDVCQVIAISDPSIEVLCPFLDKSGDSGARKAIHVTMPKATWDALPARMDGGK